MVEQLATNRFVKRAFFKILFFRAFEAKTVTFFMLNSLNSFCHFISTIYDLATNRFGILVVFPSSLC